jgi:lipoate---protein ligase
MVKVFSDGPKDAYENMQLDREILLKQSPYPVLRLYSFSSFCATIGIFTLRDGLVDEQACARQGIQIATRPSGGGLLFHEEDLSFCLYIPLTEMDSSPLEVCTKINGTILNALARFLPEVEKKTEVLTVQSRFCFSSVTPFDLVWNHKKIGGCAQRRSKYGTLHQGSIFLKKPNWDIIASVISNPDDLHQMRRTITPINELLQQSLTEQALRESIIHNCAEIF